MREWELPEEPLCELGPRYQEGEAETTFVCGVKLCAGGTELPEGPTHQWGEG